jgi:hypothetical protein
LALEVLYAVGVVARQYGQVDLFEHFRSPLWVISKFSEQC